MKFALAMIAVLCLFSSAAQARHGDKHHHPHYVVAVHIKHFVHHHRGFHRAVAVAENGRPRAWCGWYLRTLKGGGPEYNLARNWANRGSATSPQIGAVVVWSHHVGLITGHANNGQWIVKSGNDSHAVRERPRSVSGAIAFRMI